MLRHFSIGTFRASEFGVKGLGSEVWVHRLGFKVRGQVRSVFLAVNAWGTLSLAHEKVAR